MRYRTGYEMTIPYKTTGIFAGKAKQDGKVVNIDNQLNLVTVVYKDKTTDVFEFGDVIGESSGMAVNHKISLVPKIAVGSFVKKDEIITYHNEFFKHDPITNQIAWCHGTQAIVAVMPKDVTLEDSNMISAEFAEKMRFDSIYVRPITISTDMVVSSFTEVGTKVGYNDPLMKLKYEDTADVIGDVDELFDDLKQIEYRSKNDGVIVGIQVYYVAESLNASLTQFINKVTYRSRRRANATKGTLKEEQFSTATLVADGTRVRGVQLSASDILVVFLIKTSVAFGVGDKCVAGLMLKSVNGAISDKPMITEHGKNIDMVFGANSIFDRIVLSIFIGGISESILEDAERSVLNMYFDE